MDRRLSIMGVFVLMWTEICVSQIGPLVEVVGTSLKPNGSRRIMHAAATNDKISLITRESEIDTGFVGCFTFCQDGRLEHGRTYRIKPTVEGSVIHVYAFGRQEYLMVGAVDPVWRSNSFSLSPVAGDLALKQPKIVLREKGHSLGQWWLVTVEQSKKLFVLKSKFVHTNDPGSMPKREKGWLYCYNLDQIDKPTLEGVARIEDKTTGSSWIECAGGHNGPYIWQTTYKQGNLFGERTLRVARWSIDGQLKWIAYKTGPQIHFAVDPEDGSTALVLEFLEKKPSEEGLPKCDLSLVKEGRTEVSPVASFRGHYISRFQLVRTGHNKYPWAGLLMPSANDKMLLIRASDTHKAVSTTVPRPFEILDTALVSKGPELYLFRLTKEKITLTKVQDFWGKQTPRDVMACPKRRSPESEGVRPSQQ